VQIERRIKATEEPLLTAAEKAIAKARNRAWKKARELGYSEEEFEKIIANRTATVGERPWLEQYLDELVEISRRYTLPPAQELDRDFRAAGCRSILHPSPRQRW